MTIGSITETAARKCPVEFTNKVRAESPAYLDPVLNCYIVTRYADVAFVCDNPQIFSNYNDILKGRGNPDVDNEAQRRFAERGFPEERSLNQVDPPEHSRHRGLVDKIFTPSLVKNFEPRVLKIVDDLIDRFIDKEEVDFHHEFAIPLPMYIILDFLGLPRDDAARVKRWSDVNVARKDPSQDAAVLLGFVDETIDMQNYLHSYLEKYRQQPNDTILSKIANATFGNGERLPDPEAITLSYQLMVAGNETTTTALMSAMFRLLGDRDLLAAVKASPELVTGLIEETLRMFSPVPTFYRTAMEDTCIGGVPVSKGSSVAISYIGANHDPEKWPEPDCFDPRRKGVRQHLAFGRGVHFCLGHLLAKAEMRIAINRLLDRLPKLQLSSQHKTPEFAPHPFVHSLDGLHLSFSDVC